MTLSPDRRLSQERKENRSTSFGFGIYRPSGILTNAEIESWDLVTRRGEHLNAAKIQQKTGVERRWVANEYETPFVMAFDAASRALGHKKADVLVTSLSHPTGLHYSQALSHKLSLDPEYITDVYSACSGFVRGLALFKQHEARFLGKDVLFTSVEKYTPHLVDLKENGLDEDPSLAQTIFSDGATSLFFRYGEDLKILSAVSVAFPQHRGLIEMNIDKSLIREPAIVEDVKRSESGKFKQNGLEVYRVVTRLIPQFVRQAVQRSGYRAEDVAWVIPHQGSGHVVKGLSMQLPEYSIIGDMQDGNWSSASIPKAFGEMLTGKTVDVFKNGESEHIHAPVERGNIIVFAGFGAGMHASIAVVEIGEKAA